jgi:hypothetical protein
VHIERRVIAARDKAIVTRESRSEADFLTELIARVEAAGVEKREWRAVTIPVVR